MARTIFTTILFACVAACSAAEQPSGGTLLRGNVDMAMVDKARAAVLAGERQFRIDSRGGYLIQAMAIGQLMHAHGASITVDHECMSACVLVLQSAAERHAAPGAKIGFHDSADPTVRKVAAEYLAMQGTPPDLIAGYVGTVNVRPLSTRDVARLMVAR